MLGKEEEQRSEYLAASESGRCGKMIRKGAARTKRAGACRASPRFSAGTSAVSARGPPMSAASWPPHWFRANKHGLQPLGTSRSQHQLVVRTPSI